jgi:hypothetical protein
MIEKIDLNDKFSGYGDLKLWGLIPIKCLAESIDAKAGSIETESDEREDTVILAVEIQDKIKNLERCVERAS